MKTKMKLLVTTAIASLLAMTPAVANEKPEHSKKLYGEAMCSKCELKQTDECATVIRVQEGTKQVLYHAEANHIAKEFHVKVCKKVEPVKAVGNVLEKDGKKTISLTHITLRQT